MWFTPKHGATYIAKNLAILVGIILLWRGVAELLDSMEHILGGSTVFYAALYMSIGFLILYLPDSDLKEIEKL